MMRSRVQPEIIHTSFPHLTRMPILLLAGFMSSGIAALGLELIWVRVLGLAFGSERLGMLAVLAGFFGGLAAGSSLLHNFVTRSRWPIRIYIGAEAVIAVYALAGSRLMLQLTEAIPGVLGPFVGDNRSVVALSLNLTLAMMMLFPATVSMGATTVAVVEAWRRRSLPVQRQNIVAWLYATNTFGATLGVVLTTYVLLPTLGLRRASATLACFSLAAAGLAWGWDRTASAEAVDAESATASSEITPRSIWLLYGLLFCTGLAGVGLETVGTHVLSQVFENTVHTFANVLAIYLLGTALGAWLYSIARARRTTGDRNNWTSLLLYCLAAAGIIAAALLAHAGTVLTALAPPGASYPRRLIAQSSVTAMVFLLPTLWMGATFSHLVSHFTESGIGRASAVNTLGATLAPFIFGLGLIPHAGYGAAFYGAVGLYFVLFGVAHLWNRRPARLMLIGSSLAAAAMSQTYSPLVLVRVAPNVTVLEQHIGLQGVVTVTEPSGPGTPIPAPRFLQVDQSYFMGGTPGGVEKRMGNLPLLIGRTSRQVLYLGVGTGITAGSALDHDVERVAAVDLLPEIVDTLPWFAPYNAALQVDPRVSLHASDARRFVLATKDTYDVITADLYHPSRDGTASLYTREHFLAIRSRLREGGVFAQWLPLYQLEPRDLKTIVRTFLDVFPDAHSLIGSYGTRTTFALIGSPPGGSRAAVDVSRAEATLTSPTGPGKVFEGLPDLLATYMSDAESLRGYAGDGPLNTDDNQRITFDAAPAAQIQSSRDAYLTFASILPYRRPFPDEFVTTTGPNALAELRRRVASYGEAASHYLAAEIRMLEDGGLSEEALQEFLRAYELDLRFTSAPRRLLELAAQNPAAAHDIVRRLRLTHPERREIERLHKDLDGVGEAEQVRLKVLQALQAPAK